VSRREAIVSAAAIFAVAFVARAWAASLIAFPKPEDTAYYVMVAHNLVEGRGLVSDAIWSYQTPPLVFPRPAFEVWLPLPSWLAAVPMALLGPTFGAAQVMSVLVGSLVPVLAWRLGADVAAELGLPVGRARTLAVGIGLTTAIYLALVLHSALPDSTMPFAALALGACLLMTRLLRGPARPALGPLVVLGVLIGLAALTRNEAAWIGLTWAGLAWWQRDTSRRERVRAIAIPGAVAILVFLPWAVRDWQTFGSPLPGQAAANALSVTGFDIFAWSEPPTVARYLAEGPAFLVSSRLEGLGHNLFNVLVFLGLPLAPIGLVALPWTGRLRALRPLLVLSVMTFLVTSLVFPVSTTWGTYLHAAGPAHVLLVVSGLLALDRLIAWVGRRRGWTRPVAWLGTTLGVAGCLLFTAALMPSFGAGSAATARTYAALERALAAVQGPSDGPVITDFPIWLADATGVRSLALPNESPSSVVSLARAFPGTRLLVLVDRERGIWPDVLSSGDPAAACLQGLDLPTSADAADVQALDGVRAWRIECP